MMKDEFYTLSTHTKKYESQERNFWRKTFVVYAAIEMLVLTIQYAVTKYQCAECLLPASLPANWLQHLAFTGVLWFLLNRFYGLTIWRIVFLNILLFAAHHFLWIALTYMMFHSGQAWLVSASDSTKSLRDLFYGSWIEIGKYVVKVSAFYMLQFYWQYRQAEKQKMQLALVNRDLQLDLLKKQLSPHFYFNTLNNLYGLARANSQKLPVALSQLANIMGYVILECKDNKVSLAEEIQFLESYIALEKLRYEQDTTIEMKVDGHVNGQMIIPLVLIQFVENAFKHGMKEKSADNWMKVKLHIIKEQISFLVENSCYENVDSAGIGISSVKNILNIEYEGKYDLKIQHYNNSFLVNLKLNL